MSTLIDNSLFRSAVIALAYFLTAELGHLVAVFPGWNISLFWPPSGIALAAVFLFRFSAAPGIFLGAFASNLMQMPSASDPAMLLTCVGISLSSTAAALIAGLLAARISATNTLWESASQALQAAGAMGLACIVAAAGGVGSLYIAGIIPEERLTGAMSMWWLGDFSGMLIFAPTTYLAIRLLFPLEGEFPAQHVLRPAIYSAGLASAGLGVFLSLWLAESNKISEQLARESATVANALSQTLLAAERDLEAVRALVYASEDHVDIEEFLLFTAATVGGRLANPGLQGIGWAPRVTDPGAWEIHVAQITDRDIVLYERSPSGSKVPVAARREYFPVEFIQPPSETNLGAMGFDLASEPNRRKALERSRDTGQISMVAPIHLVQSDQPEPAMLICVPIYRAGSSTDSVAGRRDNITGFASSVHLIRPLFDSVPMGTGTGAGAGLDMDFHLFEVTRGDDATWYHTRHSTRHKHAETFTPPSLTRLTEGLHGTALIDFAGRRWLTVATPGPNLIQSQRSWIPWGALALILIIGVGTGSVSLERLVARQHLASEREKTEQALMEARAANESKAYFMAAAGHDIKQPLYALGMLTETLLMSEPTESAKPILLRLKDSIQEMTKHFDTLMDIENFHHGNFELSLCTIELAHFASRIDLEIAPLCAEKALVWNLDFDNLRGFSDPELLLRVFRNLLTNAVRYTDAGEVSCTAVAEGDYVTFRISDTGPGIEKQYQQTVFEQFTRLGDIAIPADARGIGLSIVRKIDEALELNLKMSSVPGEGTTFSFQIPRVDSD